MNEVIENVSLELLPALNPDRIFMIISGSEADNNKRSLSCVTMQSGKA
ncbi:hypothetical protein [Paenibacillus xylanivorans]|nr:hypothetical protein [Paenibacillus xylanivorans]